MKFPMMCSAKHNTFSNFIYFFLKTLFALHVILMHLQQSDNLCGLIVNKLDLQNITMEFDSYWVLNSEDVVPNLSKKLSKCLHLVLRHN